MAFRYVGKKAKLLNLKYESNYIEASSDTNCPTQAIWTLKLMVDSLAGENHDELIPSLTNRKASIGAERIAKLALHFIHGSGISNSFKAHSLRSITSELLEALNVPSEEIDKRGGWSSQNNKNSRVRKENYSSKVTLTNFANILLSTAIEHQQHPDVSKVL